MGKSKIFLIISLLFLLVIFVFGIYYPQIFIKPSDFVFDKFYTFQGQVVDAEKKLDSWRLTLSPENLENFSGLLIVHAPLYPEYRYGDVLQVAGNIYKPEVIEQEDGRKFFYDLYLAKENIFGLMYRSRITWLEYRPSWRADFFSAKKYFWRNLNNNLVEPESAFAKAMILDERRELTADFQVSFSQTGIIHVISISGLHIAIFAIVLQIILSWFYLSRQQIFFAVSFILLAYLFLLGFPAPAVRSALMVLFVSLGPFFGRLVTSINSLLLAALLLLFFKPLALIYDIGFQLSFLSVLGLLWYGKFWEAKLFFIPNTLKLREMCAVTLAAQTFTWPLVLYYFHIFSFISPIANLAILPFTTGTLIFGFLLAVFGAGPVINDFLAWPLFLGLRAIAYISKYLAQIPFAYIEIEKFSILALVLSLSAMLIFTFIIKPYEKDF
jgi:competence protein ComEC